MDKILVVDDEKKIRDLYKKLLTAEGYKVIEASNAAEANGLLMKDRIDVVLLDIKMPEIDGGEMYEVIKLFHRKSKVIVTSVYPLDEQKRIINDAADYYDKSQGYDALLDKIKRVLKDGKDGKGVY